MQTFWQQETGKRTGLTTVVLGVLAIGLLTGSAYGSGLAGSGTVNADNIVLPARKPVVLASLPAASAATTQADADSAAHAPAPPRKPAIASPVAPRKETRALVATLSGSLAMAKAPRKLPETAPGPTVLSAPIAPADAALYRAIFAAQQKGDWKDADRLLPGLKDGALRGHVLFQRYMHPSYRTSFAELESWMQNYADQPGADRIYRLAQSRRPAGHKAALSKPTTAAPGLRGQLAALDDRSTSYSTAASRSKSQQQQVRQLTATIRKDIAGGHPSRALRHLEQDNAVRFLDEVEIDQLRAQIAMGFMHDGQLQKARDLAAAAAKRSGTNVPMAGWVGGLTSWRLGQYKDAAGLFEIVAASPFTSPWMSAGGAYWAYRAHVQARNGRAAQGWLRQAAAQPRTFYGMIATRALGWDFDFNWDMPRLTAADRQRLEKIPAARRAMALVAAGQYHLAEQELRHINPGNDRALRQALLAYAHEAGLPAFAMRLAETTAAPDGKLYDAALYPVVPWEPEGGFAVDRALIHAIIRQESRFDPAAQSRSGATGLMQIMPATAHHIAGDRRFRDAEGRHRLQDPLTNLSLGQSYVQELLGQNAVQSDLFALAIAYNAGPGNLRKWQNRLQDIQDDPLLFIESIPVGETRGFVERVLANYWAYRLRLGQPTPSLDAVAAGQYAHYARLDKDPSRRAFRVAAAR